jgi:outer membrane protein assembly factor BamD
VSSCFRFRVLISACAFLGPLAYGCGGAQSASLTYSESARRDFENAQSAFEDNDCLTATPLFQHVRREYPYSRYAALSELRIADCELQQQHYTEAIRAYRAFIRQRPTHSDVDTANFSIARAYFQQMPQDLFLSPPPEQRDQAQTRSALRVVRRFILDYPESEHIEEARRIERQVLALLARHELYVANYYLVRDRPQATIARIQTLLEQYEGSGVEPEALILMGRTYLHMRQEREARLAFGEIVDRFPESGYRVQACEYLARLQTSCASRTDASPRSTESDEEGADESVILEETEESLDEVE